MTKPQLFTVTTPPSTHWRLASCEEVDCEKWRNGYVAVVTEPNPDEIDALVRTVRQTGREFREERTEVGVKLHFPPGTKCPRWQEHRVRVDREPLFIHGYRGQSGQGRMVGENEWHERFAETLDELQRS